MPMVKRVPGSGIELSSSQASQRSRSRTLPPRAEARAPASFSTDETFPSGSSEMMRAIRAYQGKKKARSANMQAMDRMKPQQTWNEYAAPHADLREMLERIERAGELLRIPGVEWKLEMGTLAEAIYQGASANPPAILFEHIPGYPKNYRVLSGSTNSAKRLALTLGFPVPSHPLDVVRAYRDRMKTHRPLAPRVVKQGP